MTTRIKTTILVWCIFMHVSGSLPAADNTNAVISSIDSYDGSGHGGSLRIVRFRKFADGNCTVLRACFSNGGYIRLPPRSRWEDDAFIFNAEKAGISKDRYEEVRTLCLTGLNNAREPENPDDINGSMSTRDFIAGLRLCEDDTPLEKIYCGYSDSRQVSFFEPLCNANEKILKTIMTGLEWEKAENSETAGLITDVLVTQSPKFKDSSWWWPKDRLIRMAGIKGNTNAIPTLIQLLSSTKAGVYSDAQCVIDRDLGYLVTALDDITGKGLRFDNTGNPRPLNDVVEDYLKLQAAQQGKATAATP